MTITNIVSKFSVFLIAAVAMLAFATPAHADINVTSVKVDGQLVTTIDPFEGIEVSVTVDRTTGALPVADDWGSVSYRIGSSGGYTCVNTPDHDMGASGPGGDTETFIIPSGPGVVGTYDFSVRIFAGNFCLVPRDTETLSGAVIVKEPVGILTVEKVIDGEETEALPSDFSFSIDGGAPIQFEADGSNAVEVDLVDAPFTVVEIEEGGDGDEDEYVTSYSSGCFDAEVGATCTITNTYASLPDPATITVNKVLIHDDLGQNAVTDFGFQINGEGEVFFFEEVDATHGTKTIEVPAGEYDIVEVDAPGYVTTYDGLACTNIMLVPGAETTCTITNDDVEPGTLIVRKTLVNDSGTGEAVIEDFGFRINSGDLRQFEEDGENRIEVLADGTYSVVEGGLPIEGYTTSYDGDCSDVTIASGEEKICIITNDDVPPGMGTIVITKEVTVGGDLSQLFNFDGSWGDFALSNGQSTSTTQIVGSYSISEAVVSGWTTDVSCDITGGDESSFTPAAQGGTITLAEGETVSCTFVNTQLPQCSNGLDDDEDGFTDFGRDFADPGCESAEDNSEDAVGSITIDKVVRGENANGALQFSFDPSWSETNILLSADNPADVTTGLVAGTYTIVEADAGAEWTTTEIICSIDNVPFATTVDLENASTTFTLPEGEDVVCEFENTYEPGTGSGDTERIIVRKNVTQGSDTETAFEFEAGWGESFFLEHGQEHDSGDLDEGDDAYSINEILPDNWTQQSVSCSSTIDGEPSGKAIDPNTIALENGETVTCVFLNDEEEDRIATADGDNDPSARSSHRREGTGDADGEVQGATTDNGFCPFLETYLHIDKTNNPEEVNKAKAFFNAYFDIDLALDGIFDQALFDAVTRFQGMFESEVLDTWEERFGGTVQPTGYIYQTTSWKINSILCPGYEAFPNLVPDTTV